MKKTLWALIPLIVASFALTGCAGDVADATVAIINSTQYELEEVTLQIPPSSGTYSPMKYIITAQDAPLKPGEEREFTVSLAEADFGNSGSAIISAKGYASLEGKDYTKGEVILERGTNRFEITHDGETFVITAADAANLSRATSDGGLVALSSPQDMADYVYKGEGEIGGCKAWFFDLGGDAGAYRFAVNERGELWGMDAFGKWQLLQAE